MRTFYIIQQRIGSDWTGTHSAVTSPEAEEAARFRREVLGALAGPENVRVVEVEAETLAAAYRIAALHRFAYELTPEGEQGVIPGCERNSPQGRARQLDLFG